MKVCGLLLCLVANPLLAQGGTRDPLIPRELVETLVSVYSGSGGRPEIVVGVLPPALQPKIKLPAGATVLGGVAMADGSTGVISVDGPLNSVAGQFHADLLAQGWELPVEDPMSAFRSEFIDPPSSDRRITRNGLPEMYCGRGGTLNVQYVPDGFQRTRIVIGSRGVNQCAEMAQSMFRMHAMSMGGQEVNRPKLLNHAAARNSPGACQDYNMGMGDRKTDLGSQLPVGDILSHYAKQLADSGWTQVGTTAAAIFQKRDTSGTLYEYQMVVTAPNAGADCRSVRTDLNGSRR